MDPRIVSAEHAWWFPEKKDPGHGWAESNINILTSNAYAHCDPAMGATHVRTLYADQSGGAGEGLKQMRTYELIIDHESCWGCRTCEVACKQENHAPEGIRLIKVLEEGPRIINGKPEFTFRVSVCRHCNEDGLRGSVS